MKGYFIMESNINSENIKNIKLYVIYCTSNNLPYSDAKRRVFMFTDPAKAKAVTPMLAVKEIEATTLSAHLDEYYVCGYTNVAMDDRPAIPMKICHKKRPESEYGKLNQELRMSMICYNELRSIARLRTKGDLSKLEPKVQTSLINQSHSILKTLTEATLYLPAEPDPTDIHKISFKAPVIELGGKNWLALFTDKFAAGAFDGKFTKACVAKKKLLMDYVNRVKDVDELEGIIINPGKESFAITKDIINGILLK